MATVDVDGSSLTADTQPKSVELFWVLAAIWRSSRHSPDQLGELAVLEAR